jgi:hypothetical protein
MRFNQSAHALFGDSQQEGLMAQRKNRAAARRFWLSADCAKFSAPAAAIAIASATFDRIRFEYDTALPPSDQTSRQLNRRTLAEGQDGVRMNVDDFA